MQKIAVSFGRLKAVPSCSQKWKLLRLGRIQIKSLIMHIVKLYEGHRSEGVST